VPPASPRRVGGRAILLHDAPPARALGRQLGVDRRLVALGLDIHARRAEACAEGVVVLFFCMALPASRGFDSSAM